MFKAFEPLNQHDIVAATFDSIFWVPVQILAENLFHKLYQNAVKRKQMTKNIHSIF